MVKRSNNHVAMGLGFVLTALVVAILIYYIIKSGGDSQGDDPVQIATEAIAPPTNAGNLAPIEPINQADESEPKAIIPADIYAATGGKNFAYQRGPCMGPVYSFGRNSNDGIHSLTIVDPASGTNTDWNFTISSNRSLSINFIDAVTTDTEGNGLGVTPDNHSEPFKLIDQKTIKIGADTLHECEG
jgi:hypothetical protein